MPPHLSALSEAFSNTSDPRYLFQSPTHANALRLLMDESKEGRNIRVLIGEPGVGKTLLLMQFLSRLQHAALTVHLFWTQLARHEFLHYFLRELGVLQPPADIAEARRQLTRVLEREFSRRREVVVAIDEAHNLKISVLRGLAELLDCRLARSKELRIVLAGLPQLTNNLASAEVQQISGRISSIASLSPLTTEETASYVSRRLEVFGYRGDAPFTSEAIAAIADLSEGVPRNINNICLRALFLGGRCPYRVIDCATVLKAAELGCMLTSRDLMNESSLENATANPNAAAHQQTSVSAQAHFSGAALPDAEGSSDLSRRKQSLSVDNEALATVSDHICEWFGEQRTAWCGTVGELAAVLAQPEIEVAQALHADSKILRSFGIAVCETVGRTRSVSLRRLEEPTQTTAEEANTEPGLPEGDVAVFQNFDANAWHAENPPGHAQSADGVDEVQNENAPAEMAALSRSDRALDLLRINPLQHMVKTQASGSRWTVLAVLIALAALTTGLGRMYSPVLKRKAYVARLAHKLAEAEAASKATISGSNKRTTVPGNTKAGGSSSRGQESPHDLAVPPVSAIARPLSGIRAPQDGAWPHGDKATKSFQQAALSGDPNAQFELGTAYALGRGVPADPIVGYTWLTLAFANGDEQAEHLIRDLTRKLGPSEIARIRWNLGQMYANGIGVHGDKVTAYMWYLLARVAGEPRSHMAISKLGSSMTADEKSEANSRAAQWLKRHHQPGRPPRSQM